jgi:hypothetical protein
MTSSDDEGKPSRRAELKKLHFQKSQELKKAKSKADKEAIEDKFRKLESELMGDLKAPVVETNTVLPDSLYKTDQEVSKTQHKKAQRKDKEQAKRAAIVAAVGDGSIEAQLSMSEMQDIVGRIPSEFRIENIPSDGDCMFQSIVVQLNDGFSSTDLRALVADHLIAHEEDFKFFLEEPDKGYEEYCEGIRNTAWGSELELQAISLILKRSVLVYMQDRIITIGEQFTDETEPFRVSFHLRQYSSPHYNAVVRN